MKKLLVAVLMLVSVSAFADETLKTTTLFPPSQSIGSHDGLILNSVNDPYAGAPIYTYFNLMNDGFNAFALDFVITANTVTFEGTLDDESVADSSAVWRDITTTVNNGGAASYTSTAQVTVRTPLPWNRIRVKRVPTNTPNGLALRLTRTKL